MEELNIYTLNTRIVFLEKGNKRLMPTNERIVSLVKGNEIIPVLNEIITIIEENIMFV